MNFRKALKEKVLIFDGAMGSSIHTFELGLDDYQGLDNCPEILVESRPDVIASIHESFLKVGCDCVETDTFGGSPVVLAEFGIAHRAYELNKKAALLAREVASSFVDKKRYVSGSIGPTTKIPSLGHISLKAMQDAYFEQVRGLVDGGVDVLQFETGQDLLQAKAAILAILSYLRQCGKDIPIITQVTLEAPPLGTMLVGSDISAALATLSAFPIDVIGINCATGPSEMYDPLRYLCENSDLAVSVLPNAGLPENIDGRTVYKLEPQELAEHLKQFASVFGANIVGGCCGTTPEHLARVVDAVDGMAPLRRQPDVSSAVASIYTSCPLAFDKLNMQPPLIVGERTNTNGSRKFKELLELSDLDGMVRMAREQEKEGAHILDVCTAYVGRDESADMEAFIKRLNTELNIPIMVDSTEYGVIEKALQLIAGRAIVNSINLEDGETKMMEKVRLISSYGAAAVALTIDEDGMAKDAEKKLAVAKRIYDLALSGGLKPADLVFDALTFTLSTGNKEDRKLGLATLDGIKLIKQHLPGVKTILGVSNISFGFDARIRRILNSVFLHYAVDAGLDMAIVNAQKILPLYKIDESEREFHRRLIFDLAEPDYDPLFRLLEFYDKKEKTKSKSRSDLELSVEERLQRRIIDGDRVGLDKDLEQALLKYAPLTIINTILLEGMKVVGDLFGAGKMQLPFVLQSAETMKAAVTYLEPHMEKLGGESRGTMVLATVKGDVHDIGKNLVDIILTNNGYKVINLGIKQPIENIISAALEHKADCIGMSGLLVKSTVIMKENLEILNARGINIPVILGGAALTRRYVEEDCRRVYKGRLYYGQDAFDDLRIMEALASGQWQETEEALASRSEVCSDAETDQLAYDSAAGQAGAKETQEKAEPKEKAESKEKLTAFIRSDVARLRQPEPPFWGRKVVEDFDLAEVFSFINETSLIKGQYRVRQGELSDHDYNQLLHEKVYPSLDRLKEKLYKEQHLMPRAVYGYFPCQSRGNELLVFEPNRLDHPYVSFTFPRQSFGRRLCIADFFADETEGFDVLPLQIVTMGRSAASYASELFSSGEYSDYLYFHGLAVESAEGLAELMHKRIRAELGYAGEDSPDRRRFFQQGYRGTRFSPGYPACPELESQKQIFDLLKPEEIGMELSEEYQLVPEESTSALVVVHPEAKYFNIVRRGEG